MDDRRSVVSSGDRCTPRWCRTIAQRGQHPVTPALSNYRLLRRSPGGKAGGGSCTGPLCGQGQPCDLPPGPEPRPHFLTVGEGREAGVPRADVCRDGAKGGTEAVASAGTGSGACGQPASTPHTAGAEDVANVTCQCHHPAAAPRVSASAPTTAHEMSRPHEISRASRPFQPIVPRASKRAEHLRYQRSSARQPSLSPCGIHPAAPSCGGAVTASRHLSTIFVTPPPAPRVLAASAAPRRAWNHLTSQEMLTTGRAASGVACDLLCPPTDGGPTAPSDIPHPHAAHGTV